MTVIQFIYLPRGFTVWSLWLIRCGLCCTNLCATSKQIDKQADKINRPTIKEQYVLREWALQVLVGTTRKIGANKIAICVLVTVWFLRETSHHIGNWYRLAQFVTRPQHVYLMVMPVLCPIHSQCWLHPFITRYRVSAALPPLFCHRRTIAHCTFNS